MLRRNNSAPMLAAFTIRISRTLGIEVQAQTSAQVQPDRLQRIASAQTGSADAFFRRGNREHVMARSGTRISGVRLHARDHAAVYDDTARIRHVCQMVTG